MPSNSIATRVCSRPGRVIYLSRPGTFQALIGRSEVLDAPDTAMTQVLAGDSGPCRAVGGDPGGQQRYWLARAHCQMKSFDDTLADHGGSSNTPIPDPGTGYGRVPGASFHPPTGFNMRTQRCLFPTAPRPHLCYRSRPCEFLSRPGRPAIF